MRVTLDATKLGDYGIGTYVGEIAAAGAALRPTWRFSLLAPEPPDLVAERDNVDWVPCASSGGYGPADLVALSAAARRHPADVYHAPHYVVPIGLGAPLVATIHDCIHLRYPEFLPQAAGLLPRSWSQRYARALLRRAVRGAAGLITVSRASRGDLIDLLDADPGRIEVIPNGVAPFWAKAARSSAESPLPARSVLWVGNARPHKGLDILRAAHRQLVDEGLDVTLALVGSAATTATADKILALGRVDGKSLRRLYASATLLCMPSRYEGFGLPALEAMAAGTPVVATDVGGLPEVVGKAGLLVPAEDVSALASALRRVLQQPDLAADLSRRGRLRATGFTWRRAAEATLAVYERVAGGTR